MLPGRPSQHEEAPCRGEQSGPSGIQWCGTKATKAAELWPAGWLQWVKDGEQKTCGTRGGLQALLPSTMCSSHAWRRDWVHGRNAEGVLRLVQHHLELVLETTEVWWEWGLRRGSRPSDWTY